MSLFRAENRRSLSNHKKTRTKPGNFRITTKPITDITKPSPKSNLEAYMFQEYHSDPAYYTLNHKAASNELPSLNNHTTKLDVLVHQIGAANQVPFKLDPSLLKRLNSQGAQGGKPELANFLQVRSVSLSNQDSFKKWKNIAAKQASGEDKHQTSYSDNKKKLPSIVEQESLTNDEKVKMVTSFEIKSHREREQNNSFTYAAPKASSKEERSRRKDSEPGSLPNVADTQNDSSSARDRRRRWGSESPSQEKNIGGLNDSAVKAVKRKSSLTPKRETSNVKLEPLGANRFGPLEKIKEIGVKKSTNTKTSNPAKSNNSSTNANSSNNNLSSRNKTLQSNLSGSTIPAAKVGSQSTVDTNPKNVLNSKTNLPLNSKASTEDRHHGEIASPLKLEFNIEQTSLHKGTSKQSNDSSRNENVDNANNRNGHFNFRVVPGNPGSGKKPQQQTQPQAPAQPQQNKNVKSYNPGSFSSPPQSNSGISNTTLAVVSNQSGLSVAPIVSSFVSNGSAINLRQAYPSLKIEEQPKKKAVYVPPPQSNKYKFVIGGGNNSGLVKRVLAKRDWWEETESFNTLFSLKWQQTYRGYRYDRLSEKQGPRQLLNHFEFHPEISTKNGLIKNLSTYCEANKINLFDLTPVTFCFDMDDEVNFDRDMQAFAKFFIKNNPDQNKYTQPNPTDKKNHNVWYNFDYRKKGAYQPPNQSSDKKKSPYLKPIMGNTFLKDANAWVLKPVGLNRGRGIEVFNSLETLNELINDSMNPNSKKNKKKEDGAASGDEDEEDLLKKELNCKSRTFVVQKYIEDVLLINRRKFDIRVWVLVTHDMQLYFFKEGYLRTSSEEFSLNGNEVFNKFIHLTNNAVQKFSDKYGNCESGNQLSFDDFEQYMRENNMEGDFKGKILPRMKDLVKHSMLSVGKMLNTNDRKHCFEVFGYDFMIDAEFNVWLIEVNTNPCIEESSPLLGMLIPRMIDEAFKMTVDKIFPRNTGKPAQAKANTEEKKSNLQNHTSPQKADLPSVAEGLKVTDSTPQTKEDETGVKTSEEKAAENKSETKSEQPNVEANSNVEHAETVEKNVEEKEAPKVEKAEVKTTDPKIVSSVAPNARPDEAVFSVKGYSDSESMWEYLCALPVPRSPTKRDTKFNK